MAANTLLTIAMITKEFQRYLRLAFTFARPYYIGTLTASDQFINGAISRARLWPLYCGWHQHQLKRYAFI